MKILIILLLMVLPFLILPMCLLLKDRDRQGDGWAGVLLGFAGFVWALSIALVANLQ